MKTENWDKNAVALATTGVVFLLFLLLYFFPRTSTLTKTKKSIEDLQNLRQEVAVLLPEVARTAPTTPEPEPDAFFMEDSAKQ